MLAPSKPIASDIQSPDSTVDRRVNDPTILVGLKDDARRQRKAGRRVQILKSPFLGAGKYPVAVIRVGITVRRLFYAPGGRWKIRS